MGRVLGVSQSAVSYSDTPYIDNRRELEAVFPQRPDTDPTMLDDAQTRAQRTSVNAEWRFVPLQWKMVGKW
jgi:hypothetical protein